MASNYGTAASRGAIPEVLKPIFDKQARELLRDEYNFWKYVKEADGEQIKLHGDYFEIEVQATRNDRSTNISELGDLPLGTVPSFKKGSIQAQRIAAPLTIGHEIKMLADSDVATYTTKLELLWNDAKTALAFNLNRQSLGDGTGIVATLTADDDGGGAGSYQFTVDDTTHFLEGALFDVWNVAANTGTTMLNTAPARFKVVSVDSATTVTMIMDDGAGNTSNRPNLAVNNVFIRSESAYVDTTRKTYEMNGLGSICASGTTFMGIASTVRPWNAVQYAAGGVGIGPRLMARAEIAKRRVSPNGGKVTTVWMSPEQALEVVYGSNGTYPDVRFTPDNAAKASVKNQNSPSFNFDGRDIQVKTDLYIPLTVAYAFNDAALLVGKIHDVKLEEWDAGSGLPAFNATSGRYIAADNYWLMFRGNLGCTARNEFVKITGLPTPAA